MTYYTSFLTFCQELFLASIKYYLTYGYKLYIIYVGEKIMETIDLAYLIVLCASIHLSYLYGKRVGIENTIDYLEEEKIIEFDE
jgi:hypothetical protein